MVDKAHMRVYHLDVNERSHPCDCHCTKWKKIPCIHVLRVLHWLQEYWRVWDSVGDEYRHETVQSTCRNLNEKEGVVAVASEEGECRTGWIRSFGRAR